MHVSRGCIYAALVLFATGTVQSVSVGDRCRVNETLGICKKRSNCPKVIEDFNYYNIQPKFCSFDSDEILVCCPIETTTTTTTAEPADIDDIIKEIYRREPQKNYSTSSEASASLNRQSERRASVRMCDEYRKESVRTAVFSPLLVDPVPIVRETPVCDAVSQLIVGGTAANVGEFPHMAALGYLGTELEWRCGGSLISDRFILTAAHCVKTIDGIEPTTARLGDKDLLRTDDGANPVDYHVLRSYVHPKYQTKYAYYDVALLELTETVRFSPNIRPACLWQENSIALTKATAIGYGKTDFSNAENSNKLLKVELFLTTNEACQRSYNPSTTRKYNQGIIESQICAGHPERKDTCQGDSGAGLSTLLPENRCLHYLVGVTSSGKYCGGDDPGVYTRIGTAVILDWIESTVWNS